MSKPICKYNHFTVQCMNPSRAVLACICTWIAARGGHVVWSSAGWLWSWLDKSAAAACSRFSSPQASASSLKCAPGLGVQRRKHSCSAWQSPANCCAPCSMRPSSIPQRSQGRTSLSYWPGLPDRLVHLWWIWPRPGKVIQSSSSGAKCPGGLARPLPMPGPGSQSRGFCRGCPALEGAYV